MERQSLIRLNTNIETRTIFIVAIPILFATALLLTTGLFPQSRSVLLFEDGPVENLSVMLFLVAALTGWYRWAASERRDYMFLLMAGLCTIAALDELSFGERLFDFKAPVVNGVKIDALHDLLELLKVSIMQLPGSPYLWAASAIILSAPIAYWLAKSLVAMGWRWPSINDVIPIGFASALIAFAMLADINFRPINFYIVHAIGAEEIFETTAGLVLALFVILRQAKTVPTVAATQAEARLGGTREQTSL